MMRYRTRIYIGATNIKLTDINKVLKGVGQGWTAYQTWGAWEGELERSWVIEIIQDEWAGVRGVEALRILGGERGEKYLLVTGEREIVTELIPTVHPKEGGEYA